MPRECGCAGACGPEGLTRRGFVALTGVAGAAGLSWGDWVASQAQPASLETWKRALRLSGKPRRYRSDTHRDARFPLGGIGTGNFEIGSDGQFTTWQLFNTLRDGYIPFFFAARCGASAKLLQTAGGPDWPRVHAIEMEGEYPVARLRYVDGDLPVRIDLAAFTPLAPLDVEFSSMPLAVFSFRVRNPGRSTARVSLGAFLANPIGYDATGVPVSFNSVGFNAVSPTLDFRHPNFGGNRNLPFSAGGARGVRMIAETGGAPTLDREVTLYTNLSLQSLGIPINDRPKRLDVRGIDRLTAEMSRNETAAVQAPSKGDRRLVLHLEEPGTDLPGSLLRAARDAVLAGATLVFAGQSKPLLEEFQRVTGGKPLEDAGLRPDEVFEDFESGYDGWSLEGDCFGAAPPKGTLPDQQRVSGFAGHSLVNTYAGGDDTTGRMTSREFSIERPYIRFLVGGGSHPTTQIRLIIHGKAVRSTSGRNEERLLPAVWDVREFRGMRARIEITDEQKGPWGHINVDQIEFSDLPGSVDTLQALDDLLNRSTETTESPWIGRAGSRARVRQLGSGKIVIVDGPVLPASEAEFIGARQHAYQALCGVAGARYEAPSGPLGEAPGNGEMVLACVADTVRTHLALHDWETAWEAFVSGQSSAGRHPARSRGPGETVGALTEAEVDLAPGASKEVWFLLSWRYPNKYNASGVSIGNHYAKVWPSAGAVASHAAARLGELRERTERFRKTLHDSTLPSWLLDALSSQISTIRHSGVVFRTENGDTYGWEGSNGCCQPTCSHVWGYEQTMARLFPELDRDMRRIDLTHQQNPDGGINNRLDFPSPPRPTGERPFSDGHASSILKAYREGLNHHDEAWFREYWPYIRKAIGYLIARDAASSNGEPDGTLSDDQWNTYDNMIHGVNSFIGSYYLAALRAAEEWARRVGEQADGNRYRTIFERGRENLARRCWNGEYFQQDLPDYLKREGEYGTGCLSDQLLGQWWAHQLGLGYLLPREMVQKALASVFRYNWVADLSGFQHNWRKFAGGKDKGLLICTWPKGGRPRYTIPYVDEVWTGVEYQVAAHMIYEGMQEEALMVLKGLRDRYDGVPREPMPRNPWNEIECGGHYARAMASWSVLLALTGFEIDGPAELARFGPRITPENFRALFTGPLGWGSFSQRREGGVQRCEIAVKEGQLRLKRLRLGAEGIVQKVAASLGREAAPVRLGRALEGAEVVFDSGITVRANQRLKVVLS